jgi:hypothetical protein
LELFEYHDADDEEELELYGCNNFWIESRLYFLAVSHVREFFMLVFMLHWDVGGRDPPRSNLVLWPFRFLGRKLGPCCSSSEK